MELKIIILSIICAVFANTQYVKQKNIDFDLNGKSQDLNEFKDPFVENKQICQSCVNVITKIIKYRKQGASKLALKELLIQYCVTFNKWSQYVCEGYINIELDTVLFILDNKKNLTAERVCSFQLQKYNCTDPNPTKWSIPVPSKIQKTNRYKRAASNSKSHSSIHILHLTDIHYDPLYEPGYNADCGVPLCCQKSNGLPTDAKKAAGFWGDYRVCDMPWTSVKELVTRVIDQHHFDYVYFTGDIISHKSWDTSKMENIASIKKIFKLFKKRFNVPVYPILGNHEPSPTDFFSPKNITSENLSTQWIFDLAAEEWADWLPVDALASIRKGGYYTVLVKPGFRIVALNSNVCYTGNLWLIYDDEDPFDELRWLVQVLIEAEKHSEKVHILSHIPPGDLMCSRQWSVEFRKIVNRFAKTISGQFNGHTHLDELRLFYDLDNSKKIINVAFNAGSFTTFVGFNPNYRVYDVDPANLKVLDYDHYIFNLTKANLNPNSRPDWYKLYSFKEAYGITSLNMDNYNDLVHRLSNDRKLLQQYSRFQVRESDVPENTCDEQCLIRNLCTITAVDYYSTLKCWFPENITIETKVQLVK